MDYCQASGARSLPLGYLVTADGIRSRKKRGDPCQHFVHDLCWLAPLNLGQAASSYRIIACLYPPYLLPSFHFLYSL